ncbi:MAG: hypothetical protein PVH29_09660 [Candidatus Zixiibacteriota bacterium]|jgi:hypothetical protein
MATLLFIILRLAHVIALPFPQSDFLVLCQLLALDSITAAIVFHALITRRRNKG